jgi:hypothetical protein
MQRNARSHSANTMLELKANALRQPVRKRSRRAIFLTWLRKTHLYLGLWGAVLGLLFGATGFLLNHRSILQIPVAKTVQTSVQLTLPPEGFASAEEMAAWLKKELRFPLAQPISIREHPAQEIVWQDQPLLQPARWNITIQTPRRGVNAEYFLGNRFIKLEQIDVTPIGTLTRLHMSVGANVFWVLFSDSIAGSLILLSITGLLLWTQLHTIRTTAVLTVIGAAALAMSIAWPL